MRVSENNMSKRSGLELHCHSKRGTHGIAEAWTTGVTGKRFIDTDRFPSFPLHVAL